MDQQVVVGPNDFLENVPGNFVTQKQRRGRCARHRRGVSACLTVDCPGDADNAEGNDLQVEWVAPYTEVLGVAVAACDLQYGGDIPCVNAERLREAQEDLVALGRCERAGALGLRLTHLGLRVAEGSLNV